MERKICVNLVDYYSENIQETLDCIKECGFDGINMCWERNKDNYILVEEAKKRNLSMEYVHAPFGRINHFWYEDSILKDNILATLKRCIDFFYSINACNSKIHTCTYIIIRKI